MMTILFWMIASSFILLALFIIMRPFMRKTTTADEPENITTDNIAYQQWLAELQTDIDNGNIGIEDAENSKKEMQLAILQRQNQTDSLAPHNNERLSKPSLLVLITFIPVLVVSIYSYLGRPDLVNTGNLVTNNTDVTPEQIEQMVASLEQRLQQQPDDTEGWLMLYKSSMVLERFELAVTAAEKLNTLLGDTPEVLLRYADALAMLNNQSLSGKPRELIERALVLEPDNPSALWFAGLAAFGDADYQQALDHWQLLLPLIKDDADAKQQLANMLSEVKAQLSGGATDASPDNSVTITATVSVAAELQDSINPEDTVFVFARANDGLPMPVAAVKRRAADLPFTITLNDSQSLRPDRKLSSFSSLRLAARVSKSGDAIEKPGDLTGRTNAEDINQETRYEIVISERVE